MTLNPLNSSNLEQLALNGLITCSFHSLTCFCESNKSGHILIVTFDLESELKFMTACGVFLLTLICTTRQSFWQSLCLISYLHTGGEIIMKRYMHVLLFVYAYVDVLLGDHLGSQVAVKVLKDKSMVQQFLSEAYVMTYVAVTLTVLVVLKQYT